MPARRQIARLRREVNRLEHRLRYDDLTGLHSREAFYDHLSVHASEGDGLIFLDLDDFKSVNDDYGHEIGDRLLARIAQALAEAVGPRGFVARLYGDEYLVHVPAPHTAEIDSIAEDIRIAIRATRVRLGALTISRSASIGIVRVAHGMIPRQAVIGASRAMYAAKTGGKDQATRLQDGKPDLMRRAPTVEEVRLGLQRDEFGYHVQPIIDLSTRKVMAYEALLRWHRSNGEVIGPPQFLTTLTGAYDDRTAPPLKAAHATAAWAALTRKTAIAFNISSAFLEQIARQGLHWVNTIVGDIPYDCIILELVETIIDRQDDGIARAVAQLRDRGVRIALDDFGIGHSTLERLQKVPVDLVKIDRHFMAAAMESTRDRDILHGMIDLAHASGAATVIEGVETEAQLDLATGLGATHAQGFHVGRPAPISAYGG